MIEFCKKTEIIKNIDNLIFPQNYINNIINNDCTEVIKRIPDEKIDYIFTDPPYGLNTKGISNDKNLDLFYSVLPECYRVLKENSFFATFFSIKYLPSLFQNNPFKYFWQFILYCPNGSVRSPIGFTKYMTCIVFKKGNPKLVKWRTDIFKDTDLPPKKWTLRRVSGIIAADLKMREVSDGRSKQQEEAV
ncbi:MAG: hypothetical protein HY919_09015 [Elusimicrobia bacterium]|nr:hypothetical protein [Elusimicrobiota bacterium]